MPCFIWKEPRDTAHCQSVGRGYGRSKPRHASKKGSRRDSQAARISLRLLNFPLSVFLRFSLGPSYLSCSRWESFCGLGVAAFILSRTRNASPQKCTRLPTSGQPGIPRKSPEAALHRSIYCREIAHGRAFEACGRIHNRKTRMFSAYWLSVRVIFVKIISSCLQKQPAFLIQQGNASTTWNAASATAYVCVLAGKMLWANLNKRVKIAAVVLS